MIPVRITAELVKYGNVQFLRGRVKSLPDALARELIARGDAELVGEAQYATMPRPSSAAVVPRTRKQKGRR